jgi:hypothetical protein
MEEWRVIASYGVEPSIVKFRYNDGQNDIIHEIDLKHEPIRDYILLDTERRPVTIDDLMAADKIFAKKAAMGKD